MVERYIKLIFELKKNNYRIVICFKCNRYNKNFFKKSVINILFLWKLDFMLCIKMIL